MSEDILREGLRVGSVFKNEHTLDLSYIPPRLPHREHEYRILTRIFRSLVSEPGSMASKVTIVGSTGVGKTVLARKFCSDLEKICIDKGIRLNSVYINAQEFRGSPHTILTTVASRIIPDIPSRGFSFEEILSFLLKALDDNDCYLLLTLDEVEALLTSKGVKLLISLSRLYEMSMGSKQRVHLILIVRDIEALRNNLSTPILETLQGYVLDLHSYTRSEVYDIVKYRADLAFKYGAISDEALRLVTDICSSSGNIRWAVELLLKAGRYADSVGSRIVLPIHIRAIQQSVVYSIIPVRDNIRNLADHELLLLLAVARISQFSPEEAYFPTGRVEEAYRVVCEEYGVEPKKHTQIWNYMKTLSIAGLIEVKPSSVGYRGKTTLIGLPVQPEVIARSIEDELSRRNFKAMF
ncbi:MAG: ORC1-type DNA replication protein [Candidatus Bathyarchaeia archaeon]|nr:ORC1-type DNA replication protein [Candidatus Bathyarchaeota archaeon]